MIQLPGDDTVTPSSPAPVPADPSPADTDGAADRRSNVVVAWIAVLGVLLGGVVATGSAYLTSYMQSDDSDKQYRRESSIENYTEILLNANAVKQYEDKLALSERQNPSQISSEELVQIFNEWDESITTLDRSISEAVLTSSDEVIAAAEAITGAHLIIYNDPVSQNTAEKIKNLGPSDSPEWDLQTRTDFRLFLRQPNPETGISPSEEVDNSIDEFVKAVKLDLERND